MFKRIGLVIFARMRMMFKIFTVAAMLLLWLQQTSAACLPDGASKPDSLRVMFWNLENFFDYFDGKASASDSEFSSRGARHWTKKRFNAKCNAIAKGILWTADNQGALPDIVSVAEVENRWVLYKLVSGTALARWDWGIVHYDSPDPRGIDTGLIYRKDRLELVESRPVHVGEDFKTRDIVLAVFRAKSEASCPDSLFAVLVNHHPSKYGGKASEKRRIAAVDVLRAVCDTLSLNVNTSVIALGDFNETPENRIYDRLEDGGLMTNLSRKIKGQGTIRFQGQWELIDQVLVSSDIAPRSSLCIIRIPFLMVRDNPYPGLKPFRTYSGPRWIGGVSDHCPIMVTTAL